MKIDFNQIKYVNLSKIWEERSKNKHIVVICPHPLSEVIDFGDDFEIAKNFFEDKFKITFEDYSEVLEFIYDNEFVEVEFGELEKANEYIKHLYALDGVCYSALYSYGECYDENT